MDWLTGTPSNEHENETTPPVANSSHDHHSSHQSHRDPLIPATASTSRSPPRSRIRAAQTVGHGLNEFNSLLEAAQRIASSASTDPDSGLWPNNAQPDPVMRRSSGPEGFRRRVPLTRQYSGRPHIPGEDSGSEGEEDETPLRPQIATMNRHPVEVPAHDATGTTTQTGEIYYDREAQEARQQLQRAAARLRARRDFSEERQRARDELVSRMRDRVRADEAALNAASARNRGSEHYATTGPSPMRESFYDWAPEPEETTDASTTTDAQARERSHSVRRWRPAERLQDYASNHARRSSGNMTSDSMRFQNTVDNDNIQNHPARRLANDFEDHNDIVDRVERALQEYRAARRILQPRQDVPRPTDSSGRTVADTHGIIDTLPGASAATQNAQDNLNLLQDVISPDIQTATQNNAASASIVRRSSRNESLRQRIRDYRHRQFLNDEIGSGPLFNTLSADREHEDSIETDRWRADTRRMLDKVKRAEARAKSQELKQAKAALQYLARLRDTDMDDARAWALASELHLHNQSLQESLEKNLPMSVNSLPKPAFCSWLEPGMTWTGAQSAEQELDQERRAQEQRDRVDLATRQNESHFPRMRQARDPLERALLGNHAQDALSVARNSMQVLEDAERDLSSMLERSEWLLRDNERQLRENEEQLARNRERLREHDERLARLATRTSTAENEPSHQKEQRKTKDCWNVKVTLHEVDWQSMTLTGTMTASHTPNVQPNGPEKLADETSMDSFFTGEIVDFARYGLDTTTPCDRNGKAAMAESPGRKLLQDDYKVGGPEIDLIYWAGVGPFREQVECEVDKRIQQREQDSCLVPNAVPAVQSRWNARDSDKIELHPDVVSETTGGLMSNVWTEEERYNLRMSIMHELLTDSEWLNENINVQGWILMRWKERCFVAPGTEPNPEPNRPWVPGRNSAEDLDIGSGRGPLSYADVYRRRRDTINNRRIYTTNAAERDEIRGGSSASANANGAQGSREPTWGLTISGFYYVALHRTTGRIEALYYDCGSAPFQTLKMSPATCRDQPSMGHDDVMDVDEQTLISLPGGLRTNFNMVQWR